MQGQIDFIDYIDPNVAHRKLQMYSKIEVLFADKAGHDKKIDEDTAIEFCQACINAANLLKKDDIINLQVKNHSEGGRLNED